MTVNLDNINASLKVSADAVVDCVKNRGNLKNPLKDKLNNILNLARDNADEQLESIATEVLNYTDLLSGETFPTKSDDIKHSLSDVIATIMNYNNSVNKIDIAGWSVNRIFDIIKLDPNELDKINKSKVANRLAKFNEIVTPLYELSKDSIHMLKQHNEKIKLAYTLMNAHCGCEDNIVTTAIETVATVDLINAVEEYKNTQKEAMNIVNGLNGT